jgi:hypothetical protein
MNTWDSYARRGRIILKTDLQEIMWKGVDWVDLDQDRENWKSVLSTVMKLSVPRKGGGGENYLRF